MLDEFKSGAFTNGHFSKVKDNLEFPSVVCVINSIHLSKEWIFLKGFFAYSYRSQNHFLLVLTLHNKKNYNPFCSCTGE